MPTTSGEKVCNLNHAPRQVARAKKFTLMLHKQDCGSLNKHHYIKLLHNRQGLSNDFTYVGVQEPFSSRRVVYPVGKPIIPHLLRCQGFGVAHYSLTLSLSKGRLASAASSAFAALGFTTLICFSFCQLHPV